MKNYFSSRISISERRAYVGAPASLRIQRLNGLSIVNRPVNKLPAVGDNTFSSSYGVITMSTDSSGNYLGSVYIQDPNLNPTGVSVPPAGTIGYFAIDKIPEGWMEIGSEQVYYTHKRLISGSWESNTQVLADTEYTAIYNLLNDWDLIRSVSKDTKGETFNTKDPFKGFFIRGLNPSNTGLDKQHSIFDYDKSSYLSTHRHNGTHLYSSNTGGSIDRGYRSKLIQTFDGSSFTIGYDFWFNYKWNVGLEWYIEGNGTVKVDQSGYGATPDYYAVNFDNHIHGRIKTYYRGVSGVGSGSGLYGKFLTYAVDAGNKYGTGAGVASGGTVFLTGSNTDETPGNEQQVTYFTPFSNAGLPSYTVYTDVISRFTATIKDTDKYTNTMHSFLTEETTLGTINTFDRISSKISMYTETSTSYTAQTEVQGLTLTKEYTDIETLIRYESQSSQGPSAVLTNVRTSRIDYSYYPYHILKSDPSTPDGSEFYNSGDNGTFVETTSAAGNHSHQYAYTEGGNYVTRKRGLGYENRPVNVALRMCIKY